MTRAEFAAIVRERWVSMGMKPDAALIAHTKMETLFSSPLCRAIADIATNGFDPESPSVADVINDAMRRAAIKISWDTEQAQEAAKRSRPFVGSHNLPHDTDWD